MGIIRKLIDVVTGHTPASPPVADAPKPIKPKRNQPDAVQQRILDIIGPQDKYKTPWQRWCFRISKLLRQYSQPERQRRDGEERSWWS